MSSGPGPQGTKTWRSDRWSPATSLKSQTMAADQDVIAVNAWWMAVYPTSRAGRHDFRDAAENFYAEHVSRLHADTKVMKRMCKVAGNAGGLVDLRQQRADRSARNAKV